MSSFHLKVLGVAFGCSTLATAAAPSQAAVVCNGDGDCWHSHETYTYPPAAGVLVHPDDWRFEGDGYRWREHEGRGYWHGHDWEAF